MSSTLEISPRADEFLNDFVSGIEASCKRAGLSTDDEDLVTAMVGEALRNAVTKSVAGFAAMNPVLRRSLIGAGLGAAALGTGAMISNIGKKKEDRRSVMKSMLLGGLGGAGLGWASTRFQGFNPQSLGLKLPKPVTSYAQAPKPGAVPGAPAPAKPMGA